MKTAPTVPLTPEQALSWSPTKRQQRLEHQQAARARSARHAATAPLPGPLRAAFAEPARVLLGMELQPVTATHIAALVQIENPFIEGIRYGLLAASAKTAREKKSFAQKAEAVKNDLQDAVELLLLFTSTPDHVRKLLAQGRASVRQTAIALMDTLPPFPLEWLAGALAEHYMRSFATCIRHAAKADESKGAVNFQMPASPKTDSAGSSTT